jgi:hypothetical protein
VLRCRVAKHRLVQNARERITLVEVALGCEERCKGNAHCSAGQALGGGVLHEVEALLRLKHGRPVGCNGMVFALQLRSKLF